MYFYNKKGQIRLRKKKGKIESSWVDLGGF